MTDQPKCPTCGGELVDGYLQAVGYPDVPEPVPMKGCPKCDVPWAGDAQVCPTCGGERDKPASAVSPPEVQPRTFGKCNDPFHSVGGHGTVNAAGVFQKPDAAEQAFMDWTAPRWYDSQVDSEYLVAIRDAYTGGYRAAEAESAARIAELEAEVKAGATLVAKLTDAKNDSDYEKKKLIDELYHHGFRPCDVAACNCGRWHARYGLHERMEELKEALDEAGHPLSNENGNLIGNALKELVAERDSLRTELDALRREAKS